MQRGGGARTDDRRTSQTSSDGGWTRNGARRPDKFIQKEHNSSVRPLSLAALESIRIPCHFPRVSKVAVEEMAGKDTLYDKMAGTLVWLSVVSRLSCDVTSLTIDHDHDVPSAATAKQQQQQRCHHHHHLRRILYQI